MIRFLDRANMNVLSFINFYWYAFLEQHRDLIIFYKWVIFIVFFFWSVWDLFQFQCWKIHGNYLQNIWKQFDIYKTKGTIDTQGDHFSLAFKEGAVFISKILSVQLHCTLFSPLNLSLNEFSKHTKNCICNGMM